MGGQTKIILAFFCMRFRLQVEEYEMELVRNFEVMIDKFNA